MTNELQDYGERECKECEEIGTYEGRGRTETSNWTGKTFNVRYCDKCDNRYKVKV